MAVTGRFAIRGVFCAAAALVAAAIADPLLEAASNAGWFGRGTFTDHSNLNVFPVLLLGLLFAGAWSIARLRQTHAERHGALLRRSAAALDDATIARMVPFVFVLQIGALFTMETLEQVIVYGHVLGGALWLGAPALISLCVHACFAIALAFVFGKTLHAFARTLLLLVAHIRRLFVTLGQAKKLLRVARRTLFCRCDFAPLVCRIGERAPPLSLRTS